MTNVTLTALGWSNHFLAQCADAEGIPARLTEIARDRVFALTEEGPVTLVTDGRPTGAFAVGDWVLCDDHSVLSLLERKTLLQRRAAGHDDSARQLIAANVDTLAIVTSCNADFNEARLERYLAMAQSAGCLPLVILTKADLTEDPQSYARSAERLSPLVTALSLNAKSDDVAVALAPWTKTGQTMALVGSSGVGKTTLTNALTGETAATQEIREDDAKGRHTTTARALRPVLGGGWLIDTPGMRELGLADAADGIAEVFADIEDLAQTCKFRDCAHESEPGCAVTRAISQGVLDAARVTRWRKLVREDQRNSETVAEARARARGFSRMVNTVMQEKKRR